MGIPQYVSLQSPRDEIEKRHNRDLETLARTIAANRQVDRLAGRFGIKRSSEFDDFLPFYEKQLKNGRTIPIIMADGWHPTKHSFSFVKGNAISVILHRSLSMSIKSF